jgi:alpha-beta hydrolase superfamily lysophospholipase
MIATSQRTHADDGTELRSWRWAPDDTPIGGAVLVHGLGEHGGRHAVLGEALAGAGILALAPDQRGFGASGGRRCWIDDWSTLHRDIAGHLRAVRAQVGDRPVALHGHSLGGLIVLGYVLDDHDPRPDLLVLSAPGLDDSLPAWKHALAAPLARVAPGVRIANGVRPQMLCADPADWFDYGERDPLVEFSSATRFGALALAEQRRVRKLVGRIDQLPVPAIVVHGGSDPLVPAASSEPLGRLPGVTRIVYPGLRHEIHNERDSTSVADIVAWLRASMDGQSKIASGER